ncbi:MAG: DNA replication and repair protein RecF [Verrucomicrobiota bacterium]|nr:DNA replication and repair protein RecF [Verrucomicrobiota bacterium]
MLTELRLQNFRCFDALAVDLAPSLTFFIGRNGQGKTSILEAACVLLRLQSQRSASLGPLVRVGQKWFGVHGRNDGHALDFRYSALRRKLAFDDVEQRTAEEYLRAARVVSFANTDIELARGSAEPRRRFLDFIGAQTDPRYRPTLRAYERALRSRNALLKSAHARPREIAAYDRPLLEHGAALSAMRASLAQEIAPFAAIAHRQISATEEELEVRWLPGSDDDFAAALARSQARELRVRQTVVGPHRDDLELFVQGKPAAQFASEGQQRTVVLALKIAQARFFAQADATPPLLLIDDVFGELDPVRRVALLEHLPRDAQKLITATALPRDGDAVGGKIFELVDGGLKRA